LWLVKRFRRHLGDVPQPSCIPAVSFRSAAESSFLSRVHPESRNLGPSLVVPADLIAIATMEFADVVIQKLKQGLCEAIVSDEDGHDNCCQVSSPIQPPPPIHCCMPDATNCRTAQCGLSTAWLALLAGREWEFRWRMSEWH
jgi:hypothetical protein